MRGGYLIIDLKGINLDDTKFDSTTILGNIKGIHERIESNFYKVIMLENYKVNGVEKQAVYVQNPISIIGDKLCLEIGSVTNSNLSAKYMYIDSDDNITFGEL